MPPALTATGGRVEPPQVSVPGAVYTPPLLASWVTGQLLRSLPPQARTVADFACGEGALLRAIAGQAEERDLRLIGSDLDAVAVGRAAAALPGAHFKRLDAISAALGGINRLRQRLGGEQLDGIVLNPPWGIDLRPSRDELRQAGFELARGQCDSADLFLELAVKLLCDGGAAALILPDSLFFPDRAPLRRFLLETCTLGMVARLGEGFFPGIYRGTAVVVLQRGTPGKSHRVQCLRLSPAQRKAVLNHTATLERVAGEAVHTVPQSRFARSNSADFDIDLRQSDIKHVKAVCRHPASWTNTLLSGRGVELSKHGEVIECMTCGRSRPRPRRSSPVKCECGNSIDLEQAAHRSIVREIRESQTDGGWSPLVAGDDVRRYQCAPSREIQTGITGINYKDGTDLTGPRLLVRKTGIGLKAAILARRALTTQTVFHFQATSSTPDFLLPYALGVLSSRIMLAVHLKHTGENEWRSHPYVTQALLAELPIPHPRPGSQQWRQAHAIAALAHTRGRPPSTTRDLQIERLVAGLYRLDSSDMSWVFRVLDEAQALQGIASLRLSTDVRLEPITVD